MIKFLTYTDFSLLLVHFATIQKVPVLEAILNPKKLNLSRETILDWSKLRAVLNPEGDLFANFVENSVSNSFGDINTDLPKIFLVDYGKLELDEKVLDYLIKMSGDLNSINEVYLYSFDEKSIKNFGLLKKEIAKSKIETIEITKTETKTLNELLSQYLSHLEALNQATDIGLYEAKFTSLVAKAATYQEVLDMVDMVDLAGPTLEKNDSINTLNITSNFSQNELKKQAITSLTKEEKPLPFMLGFNINNVQKDVPKWLDLIGEGELQLGLTLIQGKLEKQPATPTQKQILNELILTDQRTKTQNIPMLIWWKYFLWQARKIASS